LGFIFTVGIHFEPTQLIWTKTFVIDGGGGGFQFDGWDSFRAYQLVWTKGFCVVSVKEK
jgi:hypothetical protein